jgi:hypothetical protein
MKLAYNKDILDSEIRIKKKLIADSNQQSMDLVNTRQKSGLFKRAVSYRRRPAEAAVLIRSAVIKLERAKKTIIQPEKFSYTTKHKRFMPTTRTCFQMQ